MEGPKGIEGHPGIEIVKDIMTPAKTLRPSEVWDQVDRISRIHCCYATPGKSCQSYHAQGTRVVYGYEALAKGVQGAVYAARNDALDEAIVEVSRLETLEGSVLKSNVLEILSHLKMEGL